MAVNGELCKIDGPAFAVQLAFDRIPGELSTALTVVE
jgi:hypothetical protein